MFRYKGIQTGMSELLWVKGFLSRRVENRKFRVWLIYVGIVHRTRLGHQLMVG